MSKIGSIGLTIGASIVAVSAGTLIFLPFASDKRGQVAAEVANGFTIPDRPDWNWDVRPILSQNCFSCHGRGLQKAGLRLDLEKAAYDPIPDDKSAPTACPRSMCACCMCHHLSLLRLTVGAERRARV
jgi:hypothetical protein